MRASSPRVNARMLAPAVFALMLPALLMAQSAGPAKSAEPPPDASDAAAIAVEGYGTPPDPIARLVTAPRESMVSYAAPSPGARRYFVRTVSDGMPTLAMLGKPHYNLGGFQLDYAANRARALTTRSNAGIDLYEWQTGKTTHVAIPHGARVGATSWSPDGTTLSFMAEFPTSRQVWLADPATGKSRPLTTRATLLATNTTNWEWTADGKSVVAVIVPPGRPAPPQPAALAAEPLVRINEAIKLKTSTAADLIESPYEKALVEYYSTGQLARIDVGNGAVHAIGTPGMIRGLDAAPGGAFFRVTYLDKPFSYVLPYSSFGTTEVIVDGTGRVMRQLSTRPIRITDPPDSAAGRGASAGRGGAAADTGRRAIAWHPTHDALVYLQLAPAASGARNDSAANARRHDRVMEWAPPFADSSAKLLYETDHRITAVRFSEDGRIMFVSETGGPASEVAVFLADSGHSVDLVRASARGGAGRGRGGRGGAGSGPQLVTRAGSRGPTVVMTSSDGEHAFLETPGNDSGRVATIERIAMRTGVRETIYEAASPEITETISAPLDDNFTQAIVQRESRSMVPQSFIVETKSREARQITHNTDLMPEITNAVRKTVWARRADGHTFRVQVTLPVGYHDGTRLPGMFWFYPAEFENQEAYDRGIAGGGRGGSNRFPTYGPRSIAFLTTLGYAVIEPDAPIFAQNGQPPNDHYVDDLRDDLAATIDALDTLAIIDRQRLGIGGHSYGAFSTVNAMVHTTFFKAGIAGDGDYNRTLTPNGFQNERRDLWQGRETYLAMSPFLYADRLSGALLMYHSMEDQNVGTDPINSIRLYHALQGLGKTTALYMYPYEDHGPVARETDLDQWSRWVAWLDKYVKNAGKSTSVP